MNRSSILLATALLVHAHVNAQALGGRTVYLEEVTLPGMPGVQSFAWAQHNGEWLILGGRTDGLHQRQPFASFLAADNNTTAYVVDAVGLQVWSTSITSLPAALVEQLQCTNMEYVQRDTTLYVIGGYGYAASMLDHTTHDRLTAIDVPGAIQAIKNGQPLGPHFRSLADPRMEVTGGYLGLEGDHFHLVGGQRFEGRYNPMGPNHGPGFVQEYTNAIRRFRIEDDGVNLTIADYQEVIDTVNLHRRDYNLVPQVFPNGTTGFTAFTGVFQYGQDLPWLNTVDIQGTSYTVVPDFEQLLNQYHTAHMALYDSLANVMSTVFFGGIGRYYFDGNGTLWDDPNVPFVNTISLVERDANGVMQELAIGEMPALLGASAEFIPWPAAPQRINGMLKLDQMTADTVLVGHIMGGIESSAANIFFINTGTQSDASTRLFRVYLVSGPTGIAEQETGGELLRVNGAPGSDAVRVTLELPAADTGELRLLDGSGRLVRTLVKARIPAGQQTYHVDLSDLAPGTYLVEYRSEERHATVRFVR